MGVYAKGRRRTAGMVELRVGWQRDAGGRDRERAPFASRGMSGALNYVVFYQPLRVLSGFSRHDSERALSLDTRERQRVIVPSEKKRSRKTNKQKKKQLVSERPPCPMAEFYRADYSLFQLQQW